MKPIRVMIVDDSATVRQVLSSLLQEVPGVEVMGVASDPLFALSKMQRDWPDVIVLDVEMPRMDGITFLKKIMQSRPTPVVICSTLTQAGTRTALDALAAGAVTVIAKPRVELKQYLMESKAELATAVRAAATARLPGRRHNTATAPQPECPRIEPEFTPIKPECTPIEPAANLLTASHCLSETTDRVVAIGASTGGTQAIESILSALPQVCPGIVIVQHMPAQFTAAFAARLDSICAMEVREACSGDRVLPGLALIAPGGRHMQLLRSGAQYRVTIVDGPRLNHHRPSVDVLFRSVARCAGTNALGIILTGMGDDGARGLKEMHTAGALTLGQDEASCVVYGMPKEALKVGAIERSVPLSAVPREIVRFGTASGAVAALTTLSR